MKNYIGHIIDKIKEKVSGVISLIPHTLYPILKSIPHTSYLIPGLRRSHTSYPILKSILHTSYLIPGLRRSHTSYLIPIALLLATPQAGAYELPAGEKEDSYVGIEVTDIAVEGNDLKVSLSVDLSSVRLKGNTEVLYTPMLYSGTDTVRLEPFAVVGRNRYYYGLRNNSLFPNTYYKGEPVEQTMTGRLQTSGPRTSRNATVPTTSRTSRTATTPTSSINSTSGYTLTTPYRPWMDNATFGVDVETFGCASCPVSEELYPMAMT